MNEPIALDPMWPWLNKLVMTDNQFVVAAGQIFDLGVTQKLRVLIYCHKGQQEKALKSSKMLKLINEKFNSEVIITNRFIED